jgi:hypothetical protein
MLSHHQFGVIPSQNRGISVSRDGVAGSRDAHASLSMTPGEQFASLALLSIFDWRDLDERVVKISAFTPVADAIGGE